MGEEDEIEFWEDDIAALVESGIEDGSELAEAIARRELSPEASKAMPPHGPRAYKRPTGRSLRSPPKEASDEEILFDEGRDLNGLPTLKIERLAPAERSAIPRYLLCAFIFIALALGALLCAKHLEEREEELQRREEVIRARLRAGTGG